MDRAFERSGTFIEDAVLVLTVHLEANYFMVIVVEWSRESEMGMLISVNLLTTVFVTSIWGRILDFYFFPRMRDSDLRAAKAFI